MSAGREIDRVLIAAGMLLALTGAFVVQLLADAEAGASRGPLAVKSAKLRIVNDTSLQLSQPNESPRGLALCPGKLEPYGGGMFASPSPDSQGEGVYPHSYERLGAQSGFHVTPVLFDPNPGQTRSYQVTIQAVCGKKPGKIQDPHAIALDVPSNESRTLVAKCPKKSVLIGGGFQRAAFEAGGGVFPTESRAISKNQWQVSGTALPGGVRTDLVSIGYCMRSPKRKPLLKEVSSTVSIAPGTAQFVTTPQCPSNRRLVYSGFDTNPKQSLFYADGKINDDDSFTASAYNRSSGAATLTAIGYCLRESVIGGSLKKLTKRGAS